MLHIQSAVTDFVVRFLTPDYTKIVLALNLLVLFLYQPDKLMQLPLKNDSLSILKAAILVPAVLPPGQSHPIDGNFYQG